MATAKLPRQLPPPTDLADIGACLADSGTVTQVRFTLYQVKLADGRYRQLTRPVEVKVLWDPEVEYWIAVDNKTTFNGAGDTAQDALAEYLADWGETLVWLEENEEQLGRALLKDLAQLRGLLGLSHAA